MADLGEFSIQLLIQELGTRGLHGVLSLVPKDAPRHDVWWGDRSKCLSMTTRLAYGINREMDDYEEADDESETDEAEESSDELAKEFPQMGQYL